MDVKRLLLRKTDLLKTCRKSKFLGKKIWRNALVLKSKKVEGIFGETFIWHHCLQLSFAYEPVSQISFSLFCSRDKKLLSEFVRKRGWFQGHNERFPNIFLSLENPYTFLLAKEKTWRHIFNTNSELLQNGPEKQIMPSKATNKLAI